MFAARTSLALVTVLVLTTLPCKAQEPPLYHGELRVHILRPGTEWSVVLSATGPVWGGLPTHEITHEYDTLISTGVQVASFRYVDRTELKTPPRLAHGVYLLEIMDANACIFIDFRDCDFSDSTTRVAYYICNDIEIKFDSSGDYFTKDWPDGNWHKLHCGDTVGIWQYGRKDTARAYPMRDCFKVPTMVVNEFLLSSSDTTTGKQLIADSDVQHPIASGDTVNTWSLGSAHTLRPDSNRYQSIEPPSIHRFHHWLVDGYDVKPEYVHTVAEPTRLASKFRPTKSVTINSEIDGIEIPMIAFVRDPWGVRYQNGSALADTAFLEWSLPLELGDYCGFGGVHRMQTIETGRPYYSLR